MNGTRAIITRFPVLRRAAAWWARRPAAAQWRMVIALAATAMACLLLFLPKPWDISAALGEKIRTHDYVLIYFWWAAAINLAVLLGLAALCPWWTKPLEKIENPKSKIENPKWFLPLVALAMATTAFFGLQRIGDSFWDDEELNVRQSIWGRFFRDKKTDEVRFKKLPWEETFFFYRDPNNHVLHSVLARASGEVWAAVVRPRGLPFAEWPIRVPAFLFGILSVGAMAWLLKECSMPGAGVIAAFLAALHPWHIRYATEARGYSMVLCLIPLILILWHRAVTGGQWKWWAAFAAAQFAAIYAYPGVLFVLLTINALTLPVLAFARQSARPFAAQSGRWFVVNALAAMAVIFLMLPLVPQAKIYFESDYARATALGWPWIRNALCYFWGGAPWTKSGAPDQGYPEFLALFLQNPALFRLAAVLAAGFVILGLVRFLKGGGVMAALALTLAVPPFLTYGMSQARQILLYESYIIYALPGAVIFAAGGLAWTASVLLRWPMGRILAPAFAAVLLLAYAWLTAGTRSWLIDHPLQPMRDSVLTSRGTLDPWSKSQEKILTASFCIPPYLYDAHMVRPDSADDFIGLLRQADRENKTLVLNVGMPWAAKAYSPRMWALFNDPALFEHHTRLQGFEPSLDRILAWYRPGSAAGFDFSAYAGNER